MNKRIGSKQAAAKPAPKSKAEEAVYINPLTDFGFKKIFGDKKLMIAFLNDILQPEERITALSYVPTEQLGNEESERKAVYDLLCTNKKGESFLVEMQRAPQEFFVDRLLFYSSFLIRNQAVKGKKWNFNLKAVYVVSLLNFRLHIEGIGEQHIVNRVYLTEETTHARFSDKLRFILIELPKFQKQVDELETNTDFWFFCLKNLMRLQNVPAAVKGQIFRRLFERAQIKKLTSEEMKAYHQSVLEYDDIVDALDFERRRSEKRGIALGEKRGIKMGVERAYVEVAISCAALGMPLEDIASLTKFSVKQVQAILQNQD
ncbi:MAG: Rpn family recombination-promoting nuclease/putative transposase [Prevotellaceae bacterium]|jgi:predicted transposase/invertase (TIGR01784 family)|nr:Rpn family recombination-promoting nuclease/putative transposase [Prevotellaceae bacterium]